MDKGAVLATAMWAAWALSEHHAIAMQAGVPPAEAGECPARGLHCAEYSFGAAAGEGKAL